MINKNKTLKIKRNMHLTIYIIEITKFYDKYINYRVKQNNLNRYKKYSKSLDSER